MQTPTRARIVQRRPSSFVAEYIDADGNRQRIQVTYGRNFNISTIVDDRQFAVSNDYGGFRVLHGNQMSSILKTPFVEAGLIQCEAFWPSMEDRPERGSEAEMRHVGHAWRFIMAVLDHMA